MQPSLTPTAVCAETLLSHADLVSIVERSAGLYERKSAEFVPVTSVDSDRHRERRIQDWKKIVAADDPVRFERRLAWDYLTADDLYAMLGEVRLVEPDRLPAWTTLLKEITAEVAENAETVGRTPRYCCNPKDPVPFEDATLALVAAASSRLHVRCGKALDRFSNAARGGLERALLRRLHIFFGDTLYLEYAIFRSKRASSLDLLWMRARGETPTLIYQEFIRELLTGGFWRLWLEYPVLARLVFTAIESWLDATADLVQRLDNDADQIRTAFNCGAPIEVIGVEGLLSDSHHRGRSVSILALSSGIKVVYKPRSVANEEAWFDLLDWLNGHGSPLPFVTLRVLERSGYGWMEYVGTAPLADPTAAHRYYFRCGMLVALSYVIGLNDLHFENLVAAGEQPVLVDLETILCHSPVETISGNSTDDVLRTVFFESPLRTGLLPRWQTGQGSPVDVSGLGAVETQRSRVPVPQWKDVNSDLMVLAYETVEGSGVTNTAILNGEVLSPNDFLQPLTEGFEAMYRLLVRCREELRSQDGPLTRISSLRVRFIFRATASYLMTMKASRQPHLLGNGAERSIHLEPLAAPLLLSSRKPAGWPLLAWERQAMEIEDCPHFVAPVSSTIIEAHPDGIDGLLEAPCFDQMIARLDRLNDEDLGNQLALVGAAFHSRMQFSMHADPREVTEREQNLAAVPLLSADDLLEESIRIADTLLSKSVTAKGCPPHWITLRHLPGIERNQLDPISSDLFEGRAGIALVMAVLGKVSGLSRFTTTARLLGNAIREELLPLDPRFLPADAMLHGLTGIASLVYVFTWLSELLESPEFLDAARHAMRFLTPEAIVADLRLDVLSGAAGSILCLLRLGDPEALAIAEACANHLLEYRSRSNSGHLCWDTFEGRPVSGQAHGNSGISLALLRLGRILSRNNYRDAAVEALEFENSTFSEEHGNWPDLRWDATSFAAGWCHGAPGMSLARIEALTDLNYPHFRQDIEFCITATRQNVRNGADHICCGNFGRVLLLDELAQATGRVNLAADARQFAASLVMRARRQEGYQMMRQYSGYVTFPGVFQGSSGICLALLRLTYPALTPNIIAIR